MMSKLGYLAAGLLVVGCMALAPAPAFAGCGACGPKEKAACEKDCKKSCCAKSECCKKKKACDSEAKKSCCTKKCDGEGS